LAKMKNSSNINEMEKDKILKIIDDLSNTHFSLIADVNRQMIKAPPFAHVRYINNSSINKQPSKSEITIDSIWCKISNFFVNLFQEPSKQDILFSKIEALTGKYLKPSPASLLDLCNVLQNEDCIQAFQDNMNNLGYACNESPFEALIRVVDQLIAIRDEQL